MLEVVSNSLGILAQHMHKVFREPLVFKDSITKEVLVWKHIQSETIKDYKYLLSELIELGYTINSITIDGKRGLYRAFEDYPVQMCHFHQKRIIQRYITKDPNSKPV